MESQKMLTNFFATRFGVVIATGAVIGLAGQATAAFLPQHFATFCAVPLPEVF
jgi:hypothetical protein